MRRLYVLHDICSCVSFTFFTWHYSWLIHNFYYFLVLKPMVKLIKICNETKHILRNAKYFSQCVLAFRIYYYKRYYWLCCSRKLVLYLDILLSILQPTGYRCVRVRFNGLWSDRECTRITRPLCEAGSSHKYSNSFQNLSSFCRYIS